ncbi:MAG: hypothetical protein NC122_07390 [Faecalibacterium sp.]|nr:hypothetical protein [Ruminococcus sp.]MCM1392181.1 hypothetical protein [Ruminococcus sp.]MCM1486015.1 hypothetical protein [Faecalibacterium sp.]
MDKQIYRKMLIEIEADYVNFATVRERLKEKERIARKANEAFLKYQDEIAQYDDLLLDLKLRRRAILELLEE